MFFLRKKKAAPVEFVPVVLPDPVDPNVPRQKILVVEDDAVVAKALSMMLNARGYEAICAADSCEAIKLMREHGPDMMLVDVGLAPDVGGVLCDGFQVAQWLQRTSARKIPSIIISGSDKPSFKNRAKAVGAEAFFAKPIDGDALVESIQSALARPTPVVDEAASAEKNDLLSSLKMAVGSTEE